MNDILNFKNKAQSEGEILDNLKNNPKVNIKVQTQNYDTKRDHEAKLMIADSGKAMSEHGFTHTGSLVVHIYESEKPNDTVMGRKHETMYKTMCLFDDKSRWAMVKGAVQQLERKIYAAFSKKHPWDQLQRR
ncbi:MAG: hypothetical protein GY699_09495 [Desulfobacteraceae bacterium]|nr:hypothetical protein [Desulfobacteraceae bacterium]